MHHLLDQIPSGPGTYALTLPLDGPVEIRAGSLGSFRLAAGAYIYLGSAFGPGGLRSRLKHHLSPVRSPHWHIDYLRQAAQVVEIIYAPGPERYEHTWAAALAENPEFSIPIPRFGASDCRCPAHLFYTTSPSKSITSIFRIDTKVIPTLLRDSPR